MEILAKLGIDLWSIVLYLVNVGILIALLAKFLYKPVLEVLDKRVNLIKSSISEAETLKKDFADKLSAMQQEKQEASDSIKAQLESMRREAEVARKKLEEDLGAERSRMLASLQKEIDEEKKALETEMKKTMLSSMKTIMLFVLGDKVPASTLEAHIQEGWDAFYSQKK